MCNLPRILAILPNMSPLCFPPSRVAMVACLVAIIGGWASCSAPNANNPATFSLSELVELPAHFPAFEEPADNPLNGAKWELGRLLFHDTRFSAANDVSCASCHLAQFAMADSLAVSLGTGGAPGFRNASALFNMAWQPRFHREGGIPSLETQILAPLQEPHEFDKDLMTLVAELAKDSGYHALSEEAFARPFDAFVLTRALAAFERTLISGESPYDRWLLGDSSALSESALRGQSLFDNLQCQSCHSGLWLTDFANHNIGLYRDNPDPGAYRLTLDSADLGKFKTPSLRNLAFSAPYMFDGSLSTLEEVLDHYANGGMGHPNQDPRVFPIDLTSDERSDLLAFLAALNDTNFVVRTARWVP